MSDELEHHVVEDPLAFQESQPVSGSSSSNNNNDSSLKNKNLSHGVPAGGRKQAVLRVDCSGPTAEEAAAAAAEAEAEAETDSGRPSSVDTDPRSPCASAAAASATVAAAASRPAQQQTVRGASPAPGDESDVIHQFLIPNKLGGSMVGTRGRNINYIRAKSGASVWISRNFFDKKTQVVNVRGPAECVKSALQVIKKRFPELDVKPINTAVPIQRNPALQPTMCQLSLPVGVHADVSVTSGCRGTTLFVQLPGHPTRQQLDKVDATLRRHYAANGATDQAATAAAVPCLPRPVNPGAVCVAPSGRACSEGAAAGAVWHRAIIADVFPESDSVLMKFLDWGGYERMPVGRLKQIRTEMMHLPFQAVETHLAYVTPLLRPGQDPEEQLEALSCLILQHFLAGRRLKAQVVYYNHIGQPCVYLYSREPGSAHWRCVQEDLVQSGLLHWFFMQRLPPQLPSPAL